MLNNSKKSGACICQFSFVFGFKFNYYAELTIIMPSRKAPQKGLGMASSEASQKSSERPLRKASQKCLELFNKVSQKSSGRPSRKASQKSVEMLPNEASQKSLQKPSRKASQKSLESKTKAVVLASQKNLKSNSKAVVRRQSVICMICKKSFTSKKKLKDHNTKHHFFRHCPNCPKTFQQTRKFMLHLRSHLEDHPYECKICLECFNKKGDLLIHKKGHKNPRRLHCDMCSEVFPHMASLNRHRLVHNGPPYVCEDCGAAFSNIPDITVHSKNHVHRCFFCPKEVVTFPSNFDLSFHMSRVHPLQECDPNESEVMDSLEPCVSTGAVNLEEDSGSDSMEDLPSGDDDESDADIDNNYQRDAVEPVYNLKRKDKFICFICFDLYPSCELLKFHMKAHKWYPCNSCPRFFADAETLAQHECNFVEVPSFRCEICNTEIKCENCKKNCTKMRGDISEAYTNDLQSIVSRFPELPRVPSNYCDAAERTLLYNFIEHVKYQKEPLDVQSFNHIGFHNKCLEQILKNPGVRYLFPREYIPYIEDLYSKFQDLSQTLCNQLNNTLA
ncbi:Zinc finger protein 569 [Araneus ventricosus]|uniref:Zinc finger protein 569 n=1 Tax=Araneus ventricosus TaxID=182803 RepID=A0A4Y2G8L4_ARAVE|nr:Zinc finger protein 569 [Araneus ventricosus]